MLSTEQSVHQNPIKSLWDIACIVISCAAITPLAVQNLTDALIRGLGQIPRRPSVNPSGMCTDTVGERGGPTQRSYVRSCPKFTEARSSWALTFFTFVALWFLQTKKKLNDNLILNSSNILPSSGVWNQQWLGFGTSNRNRNSCVSTAAWVCYELACHWYQSEGCVRENVWLQSELFAQVLPGVKLCFLLGDGCLCQQDYQ